MCLCQDISSKDQEFSHKKPRRSTREQNRTPRAQGLSTSRVLVLSIFLPPRNPFALTFSGILRARFPGVTAPPPRKPRQVPRKSRPPAPPPRAYPQPCRGPKTSWIALFCPLNIGANRGRTTQIVGDDASGRAVLHAGLLPVSLDLPNRGSSEFEGGRPSCGTRLLAR